MSSYLSAFQDVVYRYAGIVATTSVLVINTCVFPWASLPAMMWTCRVLCGANVLDLIVVGPRHLRKRDYSMVVHHVGVAGVMAYGCVWLLHIPYTPAFQAFTGWILLVEFASWLNGVRYLIDHKQYPHVRHAADWAFGIVFLVVRSVSSLMSLRVLRSGADLPIWSVLAAFWYGLTCLNLYWGGQIWRKALGYPRDQLVDPTVPAWRRAVFYAGVAGLLVV